MCPLQIIKDIESLSSTLHGRNAYFIYHLSNVNNYSTSHKPETSQQKNLNQVTYIYTFFANLWLKIQNTQHYRNSGTFHHLENWHLMAQQKAQQWYSQKSKID